jgi:glycosyltransferase involved in cell wall biosynthesis
VVPEDTAGFARELKKFQENSAEEREAIGRKCRKLVQERFSMTAMHARYAEIYTQVSGTPFPSPLENPS